MTLKIRKISEYVGSGYNEFWKFKGRYRVVKGSRASKKSKTTALWYATFLNKKGFEKANLIVFRKTYRTLKDSCFTDLKWAFTRLGVIDDWVFTLSPLEATRKSTGQKILFRGLDDVLKITSVTVEKGHLCWAWIEEAYEIMNEDDFDMLDESIRGEVPKPLFKQWTITFEKEKVDKVDNQQEETKKEEVKTFTQEEIDEIVKSNVDRAVAKALHKADEQRKEAEKLAAMNAKEKAEYEMNKKRQDLEKRERDIQLRELTAEAKDMLIEKGLSSDLASILDYKEAESVKESINIIEATIRYLLVVHEQ